jgi:hypothetical protein
MLLHSGSASRQANGYPAFHDWRTWRRNRYAPSQSVWPRSHRYAGASRRRRHPAPKAKRGVMEGSESSVPHMRGTRRSLGEDRVGVAPCPEAWEHDDSGFGITDAGRTAPREARNTKQKNPGAYRRSRCWCSRELGKKKPRRCSQQRSQAQDPPPLRLAQ